MSDQKLSEVIAETKGLGDSLNDLCRTIAGRIDDCIRRIETDTASLTDITGAVDDLREVSRILKQGFF